MDGKLKVHSSPGHVTIDQVVSSAGQDNSHKVNVKITTRHSPLLRSDSISASFPNFVRTKEDTSAYQPQDVNVSESSGEEIVFGSWQRESSDSDGTSDTFEVKPANEEQRRCPPGICRDWCRSVCWRGSRCRFLHVDHAHTPKHPRPKSNEICWGWQRDWCDLGYDCPFIHEDLKYDPPEESVAEEEVSNPEPAKYPRPRSSEVCRRWLQGICHRGLYCSYIHNDIDYEDPLPQPPASTQKECPSSPPRYPQANWLLTVHDHIKVRYAAGFEVQNILTGFETPWLFLEHLPATVTLENITQLLKPYGQPEIKMPSSLVPLSVVKARFTNHEEARDAYNALNGTQHFDTTIIARLPVHSSGSGGPGIFRDSVVRVQWDAPSIVGYGGFSTLEKAQQAIAAAKKPFRDVFVTATLHEDLPAVGNFTVRFRNLPPDITKKGMKPFGDLDDLMWERLKYDSVPAAIAGIKKILSFHFNVLDFDVPPPPYVDGYVRAWLRFASPVEAQQAANHLHLRRPICMGGETPLYAHHVQSVTYSISVEKYATLRSDIFTLKESLRSRMSRAASLIVSFHGFENQWVKVKLSSESLRELSQMKGEFEKILKGEVVKLEDKIAWDPYFGYPIGIAFVQNLQRQTPGVEIIPDVVRRCLILRGSSEKREAVRRELISKIKELRAREVRVVSIPREIIGFFVSVELSRLKQELGDENVRVDLWDRLLTVRGGVHSLNAARRAVKQAEDRQRYGRRVSIDECPICLDEVVAPFTLRCGDSVCRSCLKNYLVAAIDNRFFPLTCLGNGATCLERIPLSVARELLSASEFDSVMHSAFSAHVHAHPNEFYYCPTPDCPQIYRSATKGTVLQCPSCLIRICSTCHVEQHDGSECLNLDDTDAAFKEWKKNHDVKSCPGCKVPIERAEGCNHVTCTRCQTHMCWVCSKTFPRGDGIYEHMRTDHGGIGLEPLF
ncbi:uncharacterized protein BT62DRAFT_86477 [Guyanagaster necrorhizus]|uniref:Uncharacterized protein n=1 Tax=Guyanagaster necrorhizus TaxID=856835 RepID=A0A9P8AUD0_9AGAR|nr:uncharacterized protein BT62DRAFT_86477 [Guyanagaster necrorhizus MCA 3950]KAG7446782.1 hypothetical protein BT62DRAFT_86477 [Guyanagaster necrorhizus MCA 3950]